MTDALLSSFRDDLANYVRQKETGRGRAWELLDEGVKDHWREQSLPLLEFLAEQGVMIKTPAGAIKLEDLMRG